MALVTHFCTFNLLIMHLILLSEIKGSKSYPLVSVYITMFYFIGL